MADAKKTLYAVECYEGRGDWYRVFGPTFFVTNAETGLSEERTVTKAMAEKFKADRHNPYAEYKYRVVEVQS